MTIKLYTAQIAAQNAMATRWHPKLDAAYDRIAQAVNRIAHAILQNRCVQYILDKICPINPINNRRHFMIIPRSWEKNLGDYLFYPLVTAGMRTTTDKRVERVLEDLVQSNYELVNPSHETTHFNYRIKTIDSGQVNAFATPGGGMAVFSSLVYKLQNSIDNGEILHTTIETDNGPVQISLEDVQLVDALAALIGHEMTHAAARHSMAGILGKFLCNLLLYVGRFAFIQYLKNSDEEYKTLSQKSMRTVDEQRKLESKEASFRRLTGILDMLQDYTEYFSHLFHSRQNEYEADVTGAYFAKQAGYNPHGAIYLQEFLKRHEGEFMGALHRYGEFFFTHPYAENRKKAIYHAIQQF